MKDVIRQSLPIASNIRRNGHTLVPIIADRRVVHEANTAQVRFDKSQIFNIGTVGLQGTGLDQGEEVS